MSDALSWTSAVASVVGVIVSALTLVTVRQLRRVEDKTERIERDVENDA